MILIYIIYRVLGKSMFFVCYVVIFFFFFFAERTEFNGWGACADARVRTRGGKEFFDRSACFFKLS